MKQLTETDFKYLAGLLDADGSLSFRFNKSSTTDKVFLHLHLNLVAATSIDKDGKLINWLASKYGNCYFVKSKYENRADVYCWSVIKRSELEQLIPRLVKHMVIKAKHWKTLFDVYSSLKGMDLNEDQIIKLKNLSETSRKIAGPLKPKNFATKAWTAGYLDGDGCYKMQKRKKDNYIALSIDCFADIHDQVGLELLKKTFGGNINNQRWLRGLGKQHRQFAIWFLKNMHRHSRLKKYKIERMLEFHNS